MYELIVAVGARGSLWDARAVCNGQQPMEENCEQFFPKTKKHRKQVSALVNKTRGKKHLTYIRVDQRQLHCCQPTTAKNPQQASVRNQNKRNKKNQACAKPTLSKATIKIPYRHLHHPLVFDTQHRRSCNDRLGSVLPRAVHRGRGMCRSPGGTSASVAQHAWRRR